MAVPGHGLLSLMQCLSPITIKTKNFSDQLLYGEFMAVPCGKCLICQANRRQEIATRLQLEADKAVSTWFVTLTYEDPFLPFADFVDEETGEILHLPSLDKKELQNYFKALKMRILRKMGKDNFNQWNKQHPLKYFACGEYGPTGHRPHYHFVYLNLPPEIDPFIFDEMWSKGATTCRSGELNAYAYCGKYMVKHEYLPPYYKQWIIQSNGMGKSYIDSDTIKWHTSDIRNRNYIRVNGHKVAMPRYIKEKIYDQNQKVRLKYLHKKALEEGKYDEMAKRQKSAYGYARYQHSRMDLLGRRIYLNVVNSLKYDAK